MVENSLGRLWVEGHPNDELKANWKYYLEEASQEPEVEEQLKKIRAEYAQIDPASILCADPCMGSGHILVYMFDVLMQIYLAYGYTTNEAVESIVRNNLWGMDIDDRAAQLAYFAVMMKAQQYDHRWLAKQLRHPVQPNVFALQDSGDWPTFERQMRQTFAHHPSLMEEASIRTAKVLFETFADAKEYGSIIQPEISLEELNMLENSLDELVQKADLMDFVAQADAMSLMEMLKPLIQQCRALVQKYHVVVTNPPYMGNKGMDAKLTAYAQKNYSDEKLDLFAIFIRVASNLAEQSGFFSLITQHSWMFLQSFYLLRADILSSTITQNMAHLGARAFDDIGGEVVQTTSFVLRKGRIDNHRGKYVRLVGINGESEKESAFLHAREVYEVDNEKFKKVPNSPIAYWLGSKILSMFTDDPLIGELYETKLGMSTNDNNRFLRFWYEVQINKTCFDRKNSDERMFNQKWFPYSKGGPYRKWFGNVEYVINWENDGEEVKELASSLYGSFSRTCKNTQHFFRSALTWGLITPGAFSCRYLPEGCVLGDAGPVCFAGDDSLILLSFLNSCIVEKILPAINPTINCSTGVISTVPAFTPQMIETKRARIEETSKKNISISKKDWDSFETSWAFQQHPLVRHKPAGLHEMRVYGAPGSGLEAGREIHAGTIEQAYMAWQQEADERFAQLKANEEELNRIFIDIYGLQDELTPDVDDKDVTVCKADLGRDIRSLISYAVGCMLGRYSLDKPGLAFAGSTWDESQYVTYHADHDGILPITDDEYFDDDIVGMFIDWVRTVYGTETLEENLKFIADALGGKGNPREVIRQYFLNDFYKDHLKIYQKRPIYWLFDSGKKNSFKCLIYMHRYQPDTIARIRTDYLHETQARYRNAIETLERQSATASTGERVKMTKRLNALKAQAEEARVYEEKIHHLADQMIKIDLDDGVKVNYAKFADVLAPIK